MIKRKFNKSVASINRDPIYWFREVGVPWNCRQCGAQQPKGSVSFELVSRQITTTNIPKDSVLRDLAKKHFLCLSCAEQLIEKTLDRIRLMKSNGPEGYDLVMDV